MKKRKAMTTEKARFVRAEGHKDALEFALSIGLKSDYKNDSQAKKDVIDLSGDAYSVKSGNKRWQIFLYHKSRFETDDAFQSMNGIGQILIKCIELYPENFEDYQKNKKFYKEKLRFLMKELLKKFQEKRRVKTFLGKSIFNGGEVNYWAVKHNNIFHVFSYKDVIDTFADNLMVANSKARSKKETSEQKVLFKYKGNNLGELEMRNSGPNHYKEVLFVMNKLKVLDLLFDKIPMKKKLNNKVLLYGESKKKIGRWD
ncbi:hypothetical protein A3B85_00400 [Candidatus Nomurabacteria bacterium RIFCSPHIGHO2_02_FULL_37_13]|uniref:Uncharacterized protein n=1 Tax=Candidatus Nomurabacteria bacterium RIFCSPHIGHO2_02_FULL_37_13 TaxID=1801750 RepID=A0A1F6W4F0_9BACT|nr:MAG: hypothetical protein A2640_02420 [Candidatus Nomurabacteria bacterium RIFCSPHIGHO2_01_FULL_36_23]OGI76714.1 MAG: hypothetical protein A3B85_00400 [Candidatus Nomurabacteria bacterium RIFCSPHIGHO2_02_FULL_37_13]OGI86965.1 MAG: hypothetical protein A2906_00585 [Candidatus Nomurabacteria bacterium RIFCSPLOWO2_01_FULL_37_25]